jgi:hypothetical protein
VIPHAFGERAVLKLVYAALIRAAEHWRGIRITEFEQRQLKAIPDEIDQDFTARNAPATRPTVTAAPTRLSLAQPHCSHFFHSFAGMTTRAVTR